MLSSQQLQSINNSLLTISSTRQVNSFARHTTALCHFDRCLYTLQHKYATAGAGRGPQLLLLLLLLAVVVLTWEMVYLPQHLPCHH
jgi:hypothetical protein